MGSVNIRLVWIQPQPFTDFLFSFKMKAFIICLAAIATVSGDAKPWTIAQVANGEHIRNALAENRGHNIGVITNAAIAPTPHAINSYGLTSTVSQAYTYGVHQCTAIHLCTAIMVREMLRLNHGPLLRLLL